MNKRGVFSELVGLTLTRIEGQEGDEAIRFFTEDGRTFVMLHHQDCCESVYVESIVGDLSDLIGAPLLVAEGVDSDDEAPIGDPDSFTWTFYKLATRKGYVDIRWYGTSNGYYSESVDLEWESITPSHDYSPKHPVYKPLMQSGGASTQLPARREYCMTPQEFADFQAACNPRIVVGDARLMREHAQRCAQAFWEKLGEKYGFDWTTTQPVQGKHHGFFTAQPLAMAESPNKQ